MNRVSLINEMLKNIPELILEYNKEIEWWGCDSPTYYNIIGDVLNPFLINLLKNNENEELIQKVFIFLEMMANSKDDEVVNVLMVTVLEELGDYKHLVGLAKRYMGETTLKLNEKIESWYNKHSKNTIDVEE
jgi:hypothetical protein